jgi:hypothetical protein
MGVPGEIADYVHRTVQDQLQATFDRYEKRSREHLAAELAKLKQGLRQEFQPQFQALRDEITGVRHDMAVMKAELRQEFTAGLLAQKAEIMKWMFIYWTGQAAVTVGLILAIR